MPGRLGIRRGELAPIALLALAVAAPTARSPVFALAGVGVLAILALVVFNAGALLLLLAAAFPWDDMLGFPTQTVSVVKILGALLLVGYLLRALGRDEDIRLPGTFVPLTAFVMLVLLSLLVSGDPA